MYQIWQYNDDWELFNEHIYFTKSLAEHALMQYWMLLDIVQSDYVMDDFCIREI